MIDRLGNIAKSHASFSRLWLDTVFSLTDKNQDNRQLNYDLRDTAGFILQKSRTSKCGKVPLSGYVVIKKDKETGKCSYSGVETCSSVWRCPVCASKISERRRQELSTAVDNWKAKGGEIWLMTLTTPHSITDNLKQLLLKQSKAITKLKSHRKYAVDFRSDFGLFGSVRSVEVTHSFANGWHPHFHQLLFLERGKSLFKARKLILKLWQSSCSRAGLDIPNHRGLDIRSGDFASDYVSKWGLDFEIAKSNSKIGKKKTSRTPFQILNDYKNNNDDISAFLFREYAEAFKGKRQLSYSRGLKDALNIVEKSDIELNNEETAQCFELLKIHRSDWNLIIHHNLSGYVLSLAELRGSPSVLDLIRDLRFP